MTQMSPEDLDVLRELSNIGAGHATTSLSRLLGRRPVQLCVPRVEHMVGDDVARLLGGGARPIVGVSLRISGVLHGNVLIAFEPADARALAGLLTGRADADLSLDALGRSALMEVGNILTSSYLNALARVLGGRHLPSPPTLQEGTAGAVLQQCAGGSSSHGEDGASLSSSPLLGEALVLVNEFAVEAERFVGYFFLLPHPGSLRACLAAARGGA